MLENDQKIHISKNKWSKLKLETSTFSAQSSTLRYAYEEAHTFPFNSALSTTVNKLEQ